jgi:hypothetical protein
MAGDRAKGWHAAMTREAAMAGFRPELAAEVKTNGTA